MSSPLFSVAPEGNDVEVFEPAQVILILKRLVESHALVEVSPDDGVHRYTSMVIDVDSANNRIRIDELTPREGNAELRAGRLVHVAGRNGGSSASFFAPVIGTELEDGTPAHVLEMPESVHYMQRRRYFRVPMGLRHQIDVTLSSQGKPSVTGQMADLSIGGLAMRLEGTNAREFGIWAGERLTMTCDLPNRHHLHCDFKVCFSREIPGERLLIGGTFLDLPPASQAAISRFTNTVQREMIRR